MANAVKWQEASSVKSTTLEASGAALSDNTIVEANDSAYDGGTNLDQWGWLELVGTWGTAPDDVAPSVDVYITQAPDGTNYSSAPVTGGVDCGDQLLAIIPIRKVTSAQRKVTDMFRLPSHLTKFYIDNQTGQSLGSTWALKLFRNNDEIQ